MWSATSYNELRREALHVERDNLLNGKKTKVPYVTQVLKNEKGVFVSASDYMVRSWAILSVNGFQALILCLVPTDFGRSGEPSGPA